MAGGDILLTPENLLSEASNLLNCKSQMDEIFGQIASLIAGLVDQWHGEAQQAFSDSFNQKKTVFEKFAEDMAAFAKFMQDYANKMKETEQNNKTMASKLGS